MRELPDLDVVLDRLQSVAEGVGRRTRLIGTVVLVGAVAAWALVLRRWAFDSAGAFVRWLPLLAVLAIPGFILRGFGGRTQRLGTDIERIAEAAESTISDIGNEVGIARRGGIRMLLRSLRDLGRHGDRVRSLAADAAGSARIVNVGYLAIVGLSILGAAVVAMVLLVGVALLLV